VTAAVGYRTASKIVDERTGETFDYSRKRGVEFTENILPENIDTPYTTEELWNAAETAEKRKDGIVGREYVIAIPAELDPENRKELAVMFVNHLVFQYGVAANVALHEPNKNGDSRNYHAHIITSTRELTPEGFGKKTRILDCKTTSKTEIEKLRTVWAEMANQALEKAKSDRRLDPRSFAARGIEKLPEVHMGHVAIAMERKGKETRLGNLNRKIREHNTATEKLNELKNERAEMVKEAAEEARKAEVRAAILSDWAEHFAPPDLGRERWEEAIREDQRRVAALIRSAAAKAEEEERTRRLKTHQKATETRRNTEEAPRAPEAAQKAPEKAQREEEARKTEEKRKAAEARLEAAHPRPAEEAGTPVEIPGFRLDVAGEERRYTKESQADRRDGGEVAFVDRGPAVVVCLPRDDDVILAAMRLAAHKWGAIRVDGGDEDYKRRCVALAVANDIEIGNPELQGLVKELEAAKPPKLSPREERIRELADKIAAEQKKLRTEYEAADDEAKKLKAAEPGLFARLRKPEEYKAWQEEFDRKRTNVYQLWAACGGNMDAPDRGAAEANHRLTPEYADEMAVERMLEQEREERKSAMEEQDRKARQEAREREALREAQHKSQIEKKRQEARERDTVQLQVGQRVAYYGIDGGKTGEGEIVSVTDEAIVLRAGALKLTLGREACYFTPPEPRPTLLDEMEADLARTRHSYGVGFELDYKKACKMLDIARRAGISDDEFADRYPAATDVFGRAASKEQERDSNVR
jgi:hypothetical protein